MPKQYLKETFGFSLVEIVVTVAFIAIIGSICLTAVNIWRSIRHLQWQTIAYNIAKHKMEDLRNTSFSSLPSSGSFSDPQLSKIPAGSGQLDISGTNLKDIKVMVYWQQENTTVNYTLESLFTE